MSRPEQIRFKHHRTGSDRTRGHQDWIELIDTDGPWLSLPVLTAAWPDLDAVPVERRKALRSAHGEWAEHPDDEQRSRAWIETLLADFLGWTVVDHLRFPKDDEETVDGVGPVHIGQHDATVAPSFVLHNGDEARVVGLIVPPGNHPAKRMRDETWTASPIDRVVRLCADNKLELGIATDGRYLALVYTPAAASGGSAASAYGVFDTMTITDASDLVVLRALFSLLNRRRFTDYEPERQLPQLFRDSAEKEEELTETLGVQVRRAVELLVEAIGRAHIAKKARDGLGITTEAADGTRRLVEADEVYRGAVTVMMRLVFLLFAEEKRLLPTDNPLYAESYSVAEAAKRLQRLADEGSEAHLEQRHRSWLRLLALFNAVHRGVDTAELSIPAYGGSLFDPSAYPWMTDAEQPLAIDDRTIHNVLKSVTTVWMSAGRQRTPRSLNGLQLADPKRRPKGEYRTLNFDRLDVEQIGYVYEGLLAWEGRWSSEADGVVVGLIGTESKEAEVPLRELEAMRERAGGDVAALAAAVHERFEKDQKSGIGTANAIAKLLGPMDAEQRERAERDLLSVTRNDPQLVERLMPFYGIIRADLRGQATVVLPDMLYMTESQLRGNTGAHYTPRKLADEVVKGALEPLVYEPGPLQTADEDAWRLKGSEAILGLKVADIAMGSAAFLVAACRFLGDRLLEAWKAEGDPRGAVAEADQLDGSREDPNLIEARRLIIEHCLYGADINPAAVEMAKLSLWLVSMDKERPFTFLDDRLVCGDSLLGITSVEQLEYMHLDPAEGRKLHEGTILDYTAHVRELVAEAAETRKAIGEIGDKSATDQEMKRELLERARELTDEAGRYADLLVGAGLAGNPNAWLVAADLGNDQSEEGRAKLDRQVAQWLRTDQPAGAFERAPIHWRLVFPEVFELGGFDAIVGNPPFLGGQRLTGSLGTAYREYLVGFIGRRARGSADLVAYFLLRAHDLLAAEGQAGLVATNTLAQGDTREVGLDQIVSAGVTIRSAVKSERWPSKSAALEYCAVWTSRALVSEQAYRCLDGQSVRGVIPSLDPMSRVQGNAERLFANQGMAFQGSNILGLGFTMEPERATDLIAKNSRNKDVLFPYLNGQDLNQRSDASASRWVINFHDWDLERARTYPECFDQVVRLVKPERETNANRQRREIWWRFTRPATDLYEAISELDRVIVITLVSKVVMPVMVPTGQVFSHMLGVFASDDAALLSYLSSAPHYWWAIQRASTMKGDLRYTPTDVFETLPRPEISEELRRLGDRLDSERRELMLAREAGLTDTYNMVHDQANSDADIANLREIHRLIDDEVCRCYGWDDLIPELSHDHYDTRQGTRYTIAPGPRQEILDRLLEENQRRYAIEVEQGLHAKKKTAKKATRKAAKPKPATPGQDSLF
ncbi:Eco57I restriction-modification methylase domain-containing protein [Glycomyces arizonensis]|uniref:Eco57I restriction-modification methylase domain-containing protein n=1 Tax=Glycomyces arizonensis TaxID=256035 RepID=UPI0003F99F45|nr:DNA methyltransferase [Glycomyces arizonensis]